MAIYLTKINLTGRYMKISMGGNDRMSFLWMLIVGGLIGWVAGLILGKDVPFGIIGNIIAGFIGAWLGGLLLGGFGPHVGGFAIVPALIGAIIFVFLLSMVLRGMRRAS